MRRKPQVPDTDQAAVRCFHKTGRTCIIKSKPVTEIRGRAGAWHTVRVPLRYTVDGCVEPISCRRCFGHCVQVVRDKDADGFYVGELGGRRGLVPSNMVSPVDDTNTGGRAAPATGVNHMAAGSSRLADGGDAMRVGGGKTMSPPSPRRHHRQNC